MDDLAGLDWNTASSQSSKKPPTSINANYFPTLRPTPPDSGRSTPSSIPLNSSGMLHGAIGPPVKPSTPNNDSFAQLLPFASGPKKSNLSLQQQQKLLQEQQSGQGGDRFGSNTQKLQNERAELQEDAALRFKKSGILNNAQHLSATVNRPFAAITARSKPSESSNDLLAAFSADAPVDASSNFPPPGPGTTERAITPSVQDDLKQNDLAVLDDDPFELASANRDQPNISQSHQLSEEDDDILGLLGKPVSEISQSKAEIRKPPSAKVSAADPALAELVDMGFPAERSKEALAKTESGQDVQLAVGWLLNQAHSESRSRSRTPGGEVPQSHSRDAKQDRRPSREPETESATPTWMRQQSRSASGSRNRDSKSESGTEKDPTKYAAELGNSLFKTANSLWKSGAKKINKAVADYSAETGNSQPKWLQHAPKNGPVAEISSLQSPDSDSGPGTTPVLSPPTPSSSTDEALLLESANGRPTRKARQNEMQSSKTELKASDFERKAPSGNAARIASQRQAVEQPPSMAGRGRPTRQVIEEGVQVYISPARRKKPAATPPTGPTAIDFPVSGSSASESQRRARVTFSAARANQTPDLPQRLGISRSPQSQPKAAPRKIPPVSQITLKSSTSHRLAGTAAFRLGNYADATVSYSKALQDLPRDHPLTVVLLTNRALTYLKTGDPKSCVADADTAIAVIGPSKGSGESIEYGGDEGTKDMAPFWGKAMMRRAEALEQLERWGDALKMWKECVENGVGGATSVQGRSRCEKAIGGIEASQATSRRPMPAPKKSMPRAAPRKSALDGLSRRSASAPATAEAVNRLRAANAKADQVDDEKFALADSVDARLTSWRKGKEGNLRALLGSLDTVLWEGAGWKKAGMSELIVPAKVKVAYMKGIAKVHPDKVRHTQLPCGH